MAILSDKDLKELVKQKNAVKVEKGPEIDFDLQLGPSSFDLRLGYEFGVLNTRKMDIIDTKCMENYEKYIKSEEHSAEDGVVIHPGEFILGGTLETLNIPDDLVARVEGRSSYGRLGIIVHASLPYDEKIMIWTEDKGYQFKQIGDIVENNIEGCVVGFNPETKEVSRFKITDFIENPPRDIYRVKTERGREVRVTKDHNLFTVDENGETERIKTQDLKGEYIAVPKEIPVEAEDNPVVSIPELLEEKDLKEDIMINSDKALEHAELTNPGMENYYRSENRIPLKDISTREIPSEAQISFKQSQQMFETELELTPEFAYTAGLFIAEGYQRRKQLIFANKNTDYINRVREYFEQFNVGFYEVTGTDGCMRLTISSTFFSRLFEALGIADKRIGEELFNMNKEALEELLQGLIDGDASVRDGRIEYYTSSQELAGDIVYLCSLLGKAASITHRERQDGREEYRIEIRDDPHKMLQGVPTPSKLLKETRESLDLTGKEVALELGYSSKTSIHNLESGYYETVKRSNLRKIANYYRNRAETSVSRDKAEKLLQLTNSDLYFDKVVEIEKIEDNAPNYDLEVQPEGRKIENFLGGYGGIFLSNTAGYCDPGFKGDITLEIQNLGNAPVRLYPEDRVCQVVFETMTSEAETPYGSKKDTKYMGQTGATGSRLNKEKRND